MSQSTTVLQSREGRSCPKGRRVQGEGEGSGLLLGWHWWKRVLGLEKWEEVREELSSWRPWKDALRDLKSRANSIHDLSLTFTRKPGQGLICSECVCCRTQDWLKRPLVWSVFKLCGADTWSTQPLISLSLDFSARISVGGGGSTSAGRESNSGSRQAQFLVILEGFLNEGAIPGSQVAGLSLGVGVGMGVGAGLQSCGPGGAVRPGRALSGVV